MQRVAQEQLQHPESAPRFTARIRQQSRERGITIATVSYASVRIMAMRANRDGSLTVDIGFAGAGR